MSADGACSAGTGIRDFLVCHSLVSLPLPSCVGCTSLHSRAHAHESHTHSSVAAAMEFVSSYFFLSSSTKVTAARWLER